MVEAEDGPSGGAEQRAAIGPSRLSEAIYIIKFEGEAVRWRAFRCTRWRSFCVESPIPAFFLARISCRKKSKDRQPSSLLKTKSSGANTPLERVCR